MNIKITSVKDILEKGLLITLSIFLLGYFLFPTTSKQNTFFYVAVCTPVVLLLPYYIKSLKPKNWIVIATLAFMLYLFINSFWSSHYSLNQSLKYLRYLFTLLCLFAALFITYYKTPHYSAFLFKAFIFFGFFYYLYGIFNHFTSHADPLNIRYSDRPIDEAMFAGLLLLSCIWLLSEAPKWQQKSLYLIASLPFIAILFLSKSRGPQLALILSLPISAYLQGQSLKKFFSFFIIVLIAISGVILLSESLQALFNRGLSFPYRSEIWLASLNEATRSLWFGIGASHKPILTISNGQTFNHSHNIALAIFRMGGLVGLILFMTQMSLCILSGFTQPKNLKNLWVIWLLFGFLSHLTNGQYPLTRPTSLWFAYWLPVFMIGISNSQFLTIKYK